MPPLTQQSTQILFYGALAAIALVCVVAVFLGGPLGLAAIVGATGLLISCFTHPLVPFTLYFSTLFFKEATLPGLPVSLNQILAPLFLLSAVIHIARGKALPLRFGLLSLLCLTSLYFGLSGVFGEDTENGLLYARYVVIYLIMAVCVAACLSGERTILAFAWIVVVTTAGAAIAGFAEGIDKGLLSNFAGSWGTRYRVSGGAANSIVFAWNMVYAFPFAFLLYSELRSRYTRLLAITLGLLILGAAAITFNRQTYVVIGVALFLCAFLFTYKNRVVLLGLISALMVAGAFTIFPLILKRMLTLSNFSRDISFLERRDSYLIGMEMFRQKPVFGVGFGSFSRVWREYLPADYATYFAQYRLPSYEKYMDMGLLAVMVETGVVGLLLFLSILLLVLIRTWKFRRAAVAAGDHFARNLSSTILVVLVFVTATSMIQDTFLYVRVWIFYGLAMLIDYRHLPLRSTNALPAEAPDPINADGADLPDGYPA